MIYVLGADILARIAFETFGNPSSTNWCVFVHFFDYAAWSAVYTHLSVIIGIETVKPSWVDRNRKLIWCLSLGISCYYSIQAFIQLTYINERWEVYNEGMFQDGYGLSHSLAILGGMWSFVYLKFIVKKKEEYKWI